jgi:hypothetical protein
MINRARTTAVVLVASLMGSGTITAIASTGSSSETNPAPVTTPYHPAFDAANFGGPIDNPWLPLKPGTVFRYRGVGDDGKTRELNTVRVTHRKKRIMGVAATVVLDRMRTASPRSAPSTGTRRTRRGTSGTSARTRATSSTGAG